jgi:hypothetical protein
MGYKKVCLHLNPILHTFISIKAHRDYHCTVVHSIYATRNAFRADFLRDYDSMYKTIWLFTLLNTFVEILWPFFTFQFEFRSMLSQLSTKLQQDNERRFEQLVSML